MKIPTFLIELFSSAEMKLLHEKSLELLESPGIFIDHGGFLDALENRGAKIDRSTRVVRLPLKLTQEATMAMAGSPCLLKDDPESVVDRAVWADLQERQQQPLTFSFGGAALEVIGEDGKTSRPAGYKDLDRLTRFGDGHDRITWVNNPVLMCFDEKERPIDPDLRPIAGMVHAAKHSRKLSGNEIWDARDVDFAVRLGQLVLGGEEAYRKRPLFLCVKCSISPLKIDARGAQTLYELARRNLPVGLVPMPIAGATSPVPAAAAIVIANAEILGLAAAVWSVKSEAAQSHGILSAILDMKTTVASYSSPNTVLQDAGIMQLHRRMYGKSFMAPTDYIDAKYPGYQSGTERALKIGALAACGNICPSIGQLRAGMVCSPVQACLDIEAFDWMHRFTRGIEVSADTLCLDLIRQRGIGGNFLDTDHTFEHFREEFFMPILSDRTATDHRDMVEAANAQVEKIISATPTFSRDTELCRQIDDLYRREIEQRKR